jgi:hypothetical protein
MGRASRRKREQRETRLLDAQKFRVVVCAYPEKTLRTRADRCQVAGFQRSRQSMRRPTMSTVVARQSAA